MFANHGEVFRTLHSSILVSVFVGLFPALTFAQFEDIVTPQFLAEAKLDPAVLSQLSLPAKQDDVAFRMKSYDIEDGAEINVEVAEFNPRNPPSQHWQLKSIDGRTPTAEELEKFQEKHREKNSDTDSAENAQARITSELSVVERTQDRIVIATEVSASSGKVGELPPLKVHISLDLKEKSLGSIKAQSTDSMRVGIIKINSLAMEQSFTRPFSLTPKKLVIRRTRMKAEATVLWVYSKTIEHIEEYSDYGNG